MPTSNLSLSLGRSKDWLALEHTPVSQQALRSPAPTNQNAEQLREQNASVVLMIQADMTAYRAPGEPLQLGLPERIGTPEATNLVGNISALYSPELTVGYSSVRPSIPFMSSAFNDHFTHNLGLLQ